MYGKQLPAADSCMAEEGNHRRCLARNLVLKLRRRINSPSYSHLQPLLFITLHAAILDMINVCSGTEDRELITEP